MPAPEALAFDMYGTLVDPVRIWKKLEHSIPAGAVRVAEVWRQKQLEYTFRLTAMERYEDFAEVTRKALDYALADAQRQLSAAQKDELMAQYNNLECFPDVEPGLQALQAAGHAMMVFSNGSPSMLSAIMEAANLNPYFSGFVSVDDVKVFKPAPQVYQLAANRLGYPIGEVRLISSNPFDIVGAQAAGMQVAWIDRSGGLFDTLGPRPPLVVSTLVELAEALAAS